MTQGSDRDAAMDSLLKSTLRSSVSSADRDVCPDAEAIAAWMEGSVPPAEAAKVEAHVAACVSCQEVLAVFARTELPPAATESLWRRWRLQWAVPIAAAATVVAIYVAASDDQDTAPTRARSTVTSGTPTAEPSAPGASRQAVPIAAPPAEKREAVARRDSVNTQPRLEKETRSSPVEEDRLQRARGPESALRDAGAAPQARTAESPVAPTPAQNQLFGESSQRRAAAEAVATEAVSPDPLVRWRIVATGRLERSTNAGNTWESVSLPPGLNVVSVRAPSATAAIVAAADGRQFRTDDQGKSWTELTK